MAPHFDDLVATRLVGRTVIVAIVALAVVLVVGTMGFHLIEGWPLFDSLYMVVITLTTIGFGEIHELSRTGRAFTLGLIVCGVSLGTYTVTQVTRAVIEGDLSRAFRQRRMRSQMEKLNRHFIVVGYGQLGHPVCQELRAANIPFCIIDRSPEVVVEADAELAVPVITGDATNDDILNLAGACKAQGAAVTVSSVAEAILITLSLRQLNPDIFIVTRVPDVNTREKAKRAGANQTVSPNAMGGWRMAHSLFRPHATNFIDLATLAEHEEIMLDEFQVPDKSVVVGRTIGELNIRHKHNVTIIAIRRAAGTMLATPKPNERLEQGDVLITLGNPVAVREFTNHVTAENA